MVQNYVLHGNMYDLLATFYHRRVSPPFSSIYLSLPPPTHSNGKKLNAFASYKNYIHTYLANKSIYFCVSSSIFKHKWKPY